MRNNSRLSKPESSNQKDHTLDETKDNKNDRISPENALALVPVSNNKALADNLALDNPNDKTIIGGLFSTRKPKDAGAGISSALKNVSKGVAVGAASLIALPYMGASQQGIGGFFKGVGAGVLAAVVLPVTGVCVAGYQLSRGIINTPEAIHEKSQGKKWDKSERIWKTNWYSLPEEAESVLPAENPYLSATASSKANATKSAPRSEGHQVTDTELYDILEMPTDATQEQIRRQYYKLARKYHPDKNPDDPQAKIRFQKIGEAYQVLGDEDRREQYDKFGSVAAQDMPIIDSSLFFTMLFGSEALEPYIGKLKMAMFVEHVDGQSGNIKDSEAMMEFEQRKREVQLAVLIVERVDPYVAASSMSSSPEDALDLINAWKMGIRQQAITLCQSSFGDAIVEAIAWTYENYASQYLGRLDTFLGLGGRYAKIQAQGRSMGNSWKTASAAVRAAVAARQLQRDKQRSKKKNSKEDSKKPEMEGPSPDEVKQFEEALPLILETMLNICLMDIETTVRAAAKKALKDMSVSIEIRRYRAEALVEIGKLFQEEAENFKKVHKDEKVDPVRRMEDAFIKAAQKADEERYKREGDHTGPPPSTQPADPHNFL